MAGCDRTVPHWSVIGCHGGNFGSDTPGDPAALSPGQTSPTSAPIAGDIDPFNTEGRGAAVWARRIVVYGAIEVERGP